MYEGDEFLEPSFGWVSLAPKALARARAQLNDAGQGVRDEVGFLLLHQRYADRFFPGTSVLHTRLRYALFVPWQFEAQSGKSTAAAEDALKTAEVALAKRLKESGERGVIGGLTWPKAADQPPSSIYWSALNAWGILRRDARGRVPSRRGVHGRLSSSQQTLDDNGEPIFGFEPPFVALPRPPNHFSQTGALSFVLRPEERTFLRERLENISAPAPLSHLSLLSQLARTGIAPPLSLWSKPIARSAGRDAAPLQRARGAAALAAIGRGVYAALVEDLRDRIDGRETPYIHRAALPGLVETHGDTALALAGGDLRGVEEDIGPLPDRLRRLMSETLRWLDEDASDPAPLLAAYLAAEARKLDRARLANSVVARDRRAEWQAHEHPIGYPLHYRWATVRGLLDDLREPGA